MSKKLSEINPEDVEKVKLSNSLQNKDYYERNKQRLQDLARARMSEYRKENPEANRDYRLKNFEKVKKTKKAYDVANKKRFKDLNREKRYGLTAEQFNYMFNCQNGLCAICNVLSAICVDHCHKTGKVRGLLCHPCNTAIGFMKDDVSRLKSAMEYLQKNGQ